MDSFEKFRQMEILISRKCSSLYNIQFVCTFMNAPEVSSTIFLLRPAANGISQHNRIVSFPLRILLPILKMLSKIMKNLFFIEKYAMSRLQLQFSIESMDMNFRQRA